MFTLNSLRRRNPLPEGRGGCQGFTPWTGGACPVVGEVQVVVMFRSGNTFGGLSADCWRWEHYGSVGDILAYKVLTP